MGMLPQEVDPVTNTSTAFGIIKEGEPARLTNGMDYKGNICGITDYETATGENTKDLTKAFYLPSGAPVCVASCPTEDDYSSYICKYDIQQLLIEEDDDDLKSAMGGAYTTTMECAPEVETADAWGYCVPQAAIDALMSKAAEEANKMMNKQCMTTNPEDDDGNVNKPIEATDNEWVERVDGWEGNLEGKYWKNITAPINCKAQIYGGVSADYLNPQSEDGFFDRANADMYTASNVIVGAGCGVALFLGFV